MLPHDPDRLTIPPDGNLEAEQPRWRRDFPIDVEQDNYVARRDFVKFLVLTSFAFVVGQFWIVAQNLVRRRRGENPIKDLGALDRLPVGGVIQFTYPGRQNPCLLLRPDETTLLAYGQKCTHLSCAVVPEMAQARLHCPCHEGFFDLRTGRPIAGPPRRPLPRIKLEIRNGRVLATGMEERTV